MINKLLKNPLFQLITIAVLGFFINFAFNILLSRQLNPATYGDLSFGMQLIILVSIFSVYGKNSTTIKILSNHDKEHNETNEKFYTAWCMKSTLKSILLLLFGCIILIVLTLLIKSIEYIHLEKIHIAVWILPAASIYTLILIILPFYSVNGLAVLKETIKVDAYPLFFIFILFAIMLIVDVFEPYHGIILYYLGLALLLLFIILIFALKVRHKSFFKLNPGHIDSKATQKWEEKLSRYFKGSLYRGLLGSIAYLIIETVSLIPGSTTSEDAVGYFAAISSINAIIIIMHLSIFNAIKPKVIDLYETKEKRLKLMSLIAKTVFVSISFSFTLSLITIIFGKKLLLCFGQSYTKAYIPLIMFSITNFLYTCTSMTPALLGYLDHQNCRNKIELFSCVLYLTLGYLLSYHYSLLGLSIACLVCWGTRALLYYSFSRKYLKIKPLGFI